MPNNIIKMGGNGKVIGNFFTSEAAAYIKSIETADGQALEPQTKIAINTFIRGCKIDGNWDAIKSSCILAGARTLNGALISLKGTAPTNVNFISSDYNRATGLKGTGNGGTFSADKYLNTNRPDNADPIYDKHMCVYVTAAPTNTTQSILFGTQQFPVIQGFTSMDYRGFNTSIFIENNGSPIPGRRNVGSVSNVVGFFGVSRSNNTNIKLIVGDMYNETDAVSNITYASRVGLTSYVFWYNQIGIGKAYQSDARISFYSIGQDVNLTLLKNRISTLMTYYSTLT